MDLCTKKRNVFSMGDLWNSHPHLGFLRFNSCSLIIAQGNHQSMKHNLIHNHAPALRIFFFSLIKKKYIICVFCVTYFMSSSHLGPRNLTFSYISLRILANNYYLCIFYFLFFSFKDVSHKRTCCHLLRENPLSTREGWVRLRGIGMLFTLDRATL